MTTDATFVTLEIARRVIASAILDGRAPVDAVIGTITLRPDQRAAAARLTAQIATHGGAMLAEPVGVGKTYTALAVAARSAESILVAAPAALRDMWRESLERCGADATLITHEALSRRVMPPLTPGFVIIDEAHRLRSPATRRYAGLAEICRCARVLLVTATPLQNRRSDLAAQLALYLGRRAWQLSDEELAEHVVRGTATNVRGLPRLDGPHLLTLGTNDDCLDDILALPSPVPAKDETVVAALLTYGLVHQWTSSRAALVASLQRRRTRGLALLDAVESGRQPTRGELLAWTHASDAMQLAFPELVAATATPDELDVDALAESLVRHTSAIQHLLDRLRGSPNPDEDRAELLRQLRVSHPGERIIAFCQYTETVNVLRSKLRREPGVATLTANGARVAGGRVSRETVLAQFTPQRGGGREVSAAERIDLLITTDLLSEGLNLQRASVIVHLDLPWNPARLDQRVGRARRLGSAHDRVAVYVVSPPSNAEGLLRIEERLREKLNAAQRTVGIAGRILPAPFGPALSRGLAEQTAAIHEVLDGWFGGAGCGASEFERGSSRPTIASVESETTGFLAVVRGSDGPQLVAGIDSTVSTGVDAIARALAASIGRETPVDAERAAAVVRQIDRWLAARQASSTIDFQAAAAARLRRATLTRVAHALARAPRHQRVLLAPLAEAARAIATTPLPEGAERILEALVRAELPDEAWLRSIATFGELNARPFNQRARDSKCATLVAVIVLQPPTTGPSGA